MKYPDRSHRFKKRYILWAFLTLAAVFWLYSLLLGPTSRFGVARELEKRYGRKFTVLSSENAPRDQLDKLVWKSKIFTVVPKDDPDFRFFACRNLVSDGFWPIASRYLSDTYIEDQMIRIWEEEAQAAGVEYNAVPKRYPYQSSPLQDFHSGFSVNVSFTDETIDQICALLSRSMERMLGETSAQQESLESFWFVLRYRRDSWPENAVFAVDLTLFKNLYHTDSGSEWRAVDTDPETIKQYILYEADDYERRHSSEN